MRAIYYPALAEFIDSATTDYPVTVTISGKQHFHLLKVVRLKEGELVLVLDGLGHHSNGLVESIGKREMVISLAHVKSVEVRSTTIDLAFGLPKKPAQLEAIRSAVEVGISRIIPVTTEYSWGTLADESRIQRVMESAMLQSNNPILPIVMPPVPFGRLIDEYFSQYDSIIIFTLDGELADMEVNLAGYGEHILLLIGSEGGESDSEKQQLAENSKVKFIKVPMPILRTETAVAMAAGYIHSQISQ